MVKRVSEYWTCKRYPWGCHLHHTSKESAEDCSCGDGPMKWEPPQKQDSAGDGEKKIHPILPGVYRGIPEHVDVGAPREPTEEQG